jgi:hypothetical protein
MDLDALDAPQEVDLDAMDTGARDRVTVCGTTYACVGNDDVGYRWSSAATEGVRGCRIDSLAAAASALGNCIVPPKAPEACWREKPCLYDPDSDTFQCYKKPESDVRHGMPNEMRADMACTSQVPTDRTHETYKVEEHGGIDIHMIKPLPPAPPLAAPPTTASSTTASAAETDDAWQKCEVRGRPKLACTVDADCPLSTPAFDIWFAEARKSATGTKSAHAFLAALDHPDVTTSVPPSKRKFDGAQGVKRELRAMYDADAAFRSSVDAMLGDEYADAAAKKRTSCTAGKCGASSARVRTALVDEAAVDFTLRDGKVQYVGATGSVHDAHAVSCDATSKCNNVREYGFGDAARVTVDPTTDAAFVLRFRDGRDYYVENALYASGDAACAAQLCARNAGQCPAPLCRLDADKECVPAS